MRISARTSTTSSGSTHTGSVLSGGGPHSPIGRGSGLKIRTVWVRVPVGARYRAWSRAFRSDRRSRRGRSSLRRPGGGWVPPSSAHWHCSRGRVEDKRGQPSARCRLAVSAYAVVTSVVEDQAAAEEGVPPGGRLADEITVPTMFVLGRRRRPDRATECSASEQRLVPFRERDHAGRC